MEFTKAELDILEDILLAGITALDKFDQQLHACKGKDLDKLPDEVPAMLDADMSTGQLKSIHDKVYRKIHFNI